MWRITDVSHAPPVPSPPEPGALMRILPFIGGVICDQKKPSGRKGEWIYHTYPFLPSQVSFRQRPGVLASASSYSPRLPRIVFPVAFLRISSAVTAAGQRRTLTVFPDLSLLSNYEKSSGSLSD